MNQEQQYQQQMTMGFIQDAITGCFKECVTTFNQPSLASGEQTCLQNCGKRFVN